MTFLAAYKDILKRNILNQEIRENLVDLLLAKRFSDKDCELIYEKVGNPPYDFNKKNNILKFCYNEKIDFSRDDLVFMTHIIKIFDMKEKILILPFEEALELYDSVAQTIITKQEVFHEIFGNMYHLN
jgi:hypothetical protein